MNYKISEKNGVTYITFPIFEKYNVVHGFSTRKGGVSEGCFSSMNLSFSRGDDRDCVMKNHEIFAETIGYDVKSVVTTDQKHGNHIRIVTKADCGKGIFSERDYENIDGLVTNEQGVTLSTYYADCIPTFYYDPVKNVVGTSHSGWRGTVARIGKETVEAMVREYGSKPEDILAVVGPGICRDCYEVSEDVALQFIDEFGVDNKARFMDEKPNAKYMLDLKEACKLTLLEAGILPEHLEVVKLCTCCNPDLLYSHRKMGDKRGNLAGFIALPKEI